MLQRRSTMLNEFSKLWRANNISSTTKVKLYETFVVRSSNTVVRFVIGRWNQGRQPKKWIENIKKDMDTRNNNFDEAMAMVNDRVKWKRLIAASSPFSWWKSKKEEIAQSVRLGLHSRAFSDTWKHVDLFGPSDFPIVQLAICCEWRAIWLQSNLCWAENVVMRLFSYLLTFLLKFCLLVWIKEFKTSLIYFALRDVTST